MLIAVVAQKGGVGKSSLARTLAVEFTRSGWNALLADVDTSQATSNRWAEKRRSVAGIEPAVQTQVFRQTSQAIQATANHDVVVLDGAPHATRGTAEAAAAAQLVVIPTGTSLDDLEPALLLASELANSLNSPRIAFALYKASSDAQAREARETLEQFGHTVLPGHIPAKTGYIEAFDAGRCATETRYPNLNVMATELVTGVAALIRSE